MYSGYSYQRTLDSCIACLLWMKDTRYPAHPHSGMAGKTIRGAPSSTSIENVRRARPGSGSRGKAQPQAVGTYAPACLVHVFMLVADRLLAIVARHLACESAGLIESIGIRGTPH
jgi:hypothetical protein